MREIKFRAWIKRRKKLSYAVGRLAYTIWTAYIMTNKRTAKLEPFNIIEKDGDVLEQYTGLKDKNGKEIYEGDIVTFMVEYFDSVTLGFDSEQWYTAVVEWNQDDACYSFVDGDTPFSVQYEAEVIGNIHENPELLKELKAA